MFLVSCKALQGKLDLLDRDRKVGGEVRFRFMNMLFNGAPAGIMNFGHFGSAQEEGWSGGAGGALPLSRSFHAHPF